MRVGPYEITGELGSGGMAKVYLASDPAAGREVALKVLLEGREANSHYRTRFLREAHALAKLNHPNVLQVFDLGQHQGTTYIALAYHREGSLADKLAKSGPLTVPEAVQLGADLASGLHAAHMADVLHRDLKPDNVLLRPDGSALLSDFGLAKDLGREGQTQDLTKSGTLQGTPGYWAPEQATGKAGAVGPRTDVYGLGAILYAALTGSAPIQGEGLLAVLAATVGQTPTPIRATRPEVPPRLEAAILRCLEKEPQARWGSVQELALELEACRGLEQGARGGLLKPALIGACGLLIGVGLFVAYEAREPKVSPLAPTSSVAPKTPEATPLASPSQTPLDEAAAEAAYLEAMREFEGKRYASAARLFRRAASSGHPAALNGLGMLHWTGKGLERDDRLAADYFRRSAEAGYVEAMTNLGQALHLGRGLPKNLPESRAWFRRASKLGLPKGHFLYASSLFEGRGGPADAAEAVHLYRLAFKGGFAEAARFLAQAHLEGRGVPANHSLAVEWLRRGVELESTSCMLALADAYRTGAGVPPNPAQSLALLRRAARLGDTGAMYNLGIALQQGHGARRDPVGAAKWFRRGAEGDHAGAMNSFGVALAMGNGVPKNLPLSVTWFERAAQKGHPGAMHNYARALSQGWGSDKDPVSTGTGARRIRATSAPCIASRTSSRAESTHRRTTPSP